MRLDRVILGYVRSKWSFYRRHAQCKLRSRCRAVGVDNESESSVLRVFGGCLGAERRRRTWYAAISRGEVRTTFDPRISEWGNPPSISVIPKKTVWTHSLERLSCIGDFRIFCACLWTNRDHKKVFMTEYIGHKGKPGELKHLSTQRKGHQRDSVSSGERTRTRPMLLFF